MAEVRTVKKTKPIAKAPVAKAPVAKAPEKRVDLVVRSRFVKMAPRKIRQVSKTLIGQDLNEALNRLRFIPRRAVLPLELILKNGSSQAKDKNFSQIWIKNIVVDEGPKLKRRRIIHRGRATAILKRMSHITVVLSPEQPKAKGKMQKAKRNEKNEK